MSEQRWVWGAELSPFVLKLEAQLRYAGMPFGRLPRDGSRWSNLRQVGRLERSKKYRAILRYPELSDLDEYPLTPFLIEPGGAIYYDSSALAHWIDDCHPPSTGPLFPPDRLLRFVAQLIDEAFDEFGLYMVHHNRWKVAALGNDPGRRLASEMAKIIPPGAGSLYAQWFGRRQVRRLPYLFSVAPEGYRVAGLSPAMTPPSLPDFPPTHDLLEIAWRACLAATEAILGEQRFLLGDRFTVADASVYGQLSMNLTDLAADGLMRELAPRTHEWLCGIRDGAHVNSQGPLFLGDNLSALLDIIGGTFISLMRQNANAYEENRARGETLFNEAAFDRGRSLYFGELLGRPYRAVVKTFQVRVWNDLLSAWQSLQPGERQQLLSVSDALADFG